MPFRAGCPVERADRGGHWGVAQHPGIAAALALLAALAYALRESEPAKARREGGAP